MTQSDAVGHGMPSSPLDGKHGQTTSGVSCKHRLWEAQTVGLRRAWHAIIAFGQHTQMNDVGRGIPSTPLGSTHCRTMLGVAFHHRLWEAHTVEQRRAWHANIAFWKHRRSDGVGLACHHRLWEADTIERHRACHAIITFGLADTVGERRAWHAIIALGLQTQSNDVGRGMPSSPLDNTPGRQRWVWHDITALELHTRSATSGVA